MKRKPIRGRLNLEIGSERKAETRERPVKMSSPLAESPRGRDYRLYDSGAVGIAAFICCPLAGAILIAINYSRLGKSGKGFLVILSGLALNGLNFLLRFVWVTQRGSSERLAFDAVELALLILLWFGTWHFAKTEQGDAIREHVARGGQLGSRFSAALVGLATAAALVLVGVTTAIIVAGARR